MKKEDKLKELQAELDKVKKENIELKDQLSIFMKSVLDRIRLAAILETSDDAIISKDLNGIITSWNKGAELIFGYTGEEVIGKPIAVLIPPDRYDEEPTILAKLKRGERIDHYETIRQRKDGKLIDISLTISPIKDTDGKVVGASKIARDITAQKQAERERLELLEREQEARIFAEEANRLKDEFIATVSHELRTPLTSMLGWVRLILTGSLDEVGVIKALETIERNVKSQAQLIEDLLDISRITTGKLRLECKPVNLASVISAAIDSLSPTAEAKNIKLQIIIDSSVGLINGDFERLQQIVWNLLSNAIKFTAAGGKVQIHLERKGSQVEVIVNDTGKGINSDFLPYIFEPFRQADSSTTRHYGGLGMGLTIVKRLTELHGGTVKVFSEGEGKGTTFTLEFPMLQLTKSTEEPQGLYPKVMGTEKLICPPTISGLEILVVDDEPDTCLVLKTIFEQCGANVKTAFSVEEAIKIIDDWKPKVLVSDIGMPGLNGYDLIRQLRARKEEEVGKIPAIALTAFARIEDRMKVLSAGFQMHVPKPVEPAELLAIVASLTGIIGKG
jgi:PAS domain S-box-containing protein